ncbi:hypothetical protein LG943_05835 [Streptomonospora sp. S1-112]|uniref:Uncharacterized protein n=1 Tax=Streptomonospora mangrovi TaxID=2883123 RepID=A0A9X3SG73_9ACTN|nr:hypothetical protein [Streptomonospora mangrovi]MDA0563849.1 hypothetical protein [Streptomonospora mangrovi]
MDPLLPLIIIGMLLFFCALLFLAFGLPALKKRRRTRELSEWAARSGWEYAEKRSDLLGALFPPLPPHLLAYHEARHVLSGTHRGRPVLAFEHVEPNHRTGPGGSPAIVNRVIAVPTPGSTPLLDIRDQRIGHKLLDIIGLHDFVVGHPGFDGAFRVATSHEGFARAVLTGPMMERILHTAPRRPLRFCGSHLMTTERAALDPAEITAIADQLIDLLEHVDPRVWRGGAPA